jgi:hypothetical protein
MRVRPWKPPEKAITAERLVWYRAILTAFSSASAPEVRKDRFLGKIAGGERVQSLGQPHIRLVRHDVETGVRKRLGLLRHRGHDLGVAMPGIQHRDPRGKIDETPAVDVPYFRILGFDRVDPLGSHAVRHRRRLAGLSSEDLDMCVSQSALLSLGTVSLAVILSKT